MAQRIAGDFDYDSRGHGYARHRRPDPRIQAMVHEAFGAARTVLNVGAGAGSYEPTDREVIAVEPSATMRAQRPAHLPPAIDAIAEALPLADQSVDASMASVTVHQWRDLAKGLGELRRVTRGAIVILTFDGDALERFWLADYAPEIIAVERLRYPAIDTIRALLGGDTSVRTVPIPVDCVDGVTEAYYARPELFLDPAVRASQSAWAFVAEEAQQRIIRTLRDDLASGAWDRRYGHLRNQPTFAGSMRLIVSQPPR